VKLQRITVSALTRATADCFKLSLVPCRDKILPYGTSKIGPALRLLSGERTLGIRRPAAHLSGDSATKSRFIACRSGLP
jgi:hypothetical protein